MNLYLDGEKCRPGFLREISNIDHEKLDTCAPVGHHKEETEQLDNLYHQGTNLKYLKIVNLISKWNIF